MKKFSIKSMTLLFITMLISSCASFYGSGMTGSANLSSNNFKYVETGVIGKSSVTRILGIGGLNKNALVAEAKSQILKKTPLQDGQALANISVDFKYSYIFIASTTTCTVSADIVAFK